MSELNNKKLNISLWTAQLIIAAVFTLAGLAKINAPISELAEQMPWAGDVPEWLVRFVSVTAIAGALGVILPSLFRILPILTPLAALGLAVQMILAAGMHASRGEFVMLGTNLPLALLCLFIAWGRYKALPIQDRSKQNG